MDEQVTPVEFSAPPPLTAAAPGERGRTARELLVAQRRRLEQAEAELAAQIQAVESSFISSQQGHTDSELAELERQRNQLNQHAGQLAQRKAELDQRQADLQRQEQEVARSHLTQIEQLQNDRLQLTQQQEQLEAANGQLRQAQRALTVANEEQQSESEQLVRRRARLDEQEKQHVTDRKELDAAREETAAQRRRMIQQLDEERRSHQQDLQQRRGELEAQLDQERQILRQKRADLETQAAEVEQQRRVLHQQRRELDQRQIDFELAQAAGAADHSAEQQTLRRDCELWHQRASEAESRLAEAKTKLFDAETRLSQTETSDGGSRNEELQRRFEMAVDDVRSLKRRNAELEEALADLKTGAAPSVAADNGNLDWESMKRRMMASLEGNEPDTASLSSDDRLTVEGTIRITDDIVAAKEREIAELRQRLAQSHDDAPANGDAQTMADQTVTVAEILDGDELIRQERERLKVLEDEIREKQRQTEIELSVERARNARERAEIEEKLHTYETELARLGAGPGGVSDPQNQKPVRGRWLARLGLKDPEP